MPQLTIRRLRGTYTTHHTTAIHPFSGGTRVRHRIDCQPVSGSIARVVISMPVGEAALVSPWTLVRNEAALALQGSQATSSVLSSNSTETQYEVVLPVAVTHPFALEADVTLTGGAGRVTVPLPSLPQSVGQEGLIVMPENLCNVAGSAGLEILPANACCEKNELPMNLASWPIA